MLELVFDEEELYDEETEQFIHREAFKVELEHSLRSVSKWEEKYEKPFLNTELTGEELLFYIKCMDYNNVLTEKMLLRFGPKEFKTINEYLSAKHTATTITDREQKGGRKEVVTSELIYYWMIAMEIPFECDTWNLNRLIMLIRVCGIKNNPKKMSKKDTMMSNSQLNKLRKHSWGTRG